MGDRRQTPQRSIAEAIEHAGSQRARCVAVGREPAFAGADDRDRRVRFPLDTKVPSGSAGSAVRTGRPAGSARGSVRTANPFGLFVAGVGAGPQTKSLGGWGHGGWGQVQINYSLSAPLRQGFQPAPYAARCLSQVNMRKCWME